MFYLTGFADEAADSIDNQIRIIQTLGWNHLELRAVNGINAHDLPEEDFSLVCKKLEESGIKVSCMGTNIANWGASIESPFEETLEILDRVIDRAGRLHTPFVRIMSYAVLLGKDGEVLEDQKEEERFRRLRTICERLLEYDILPLHENCFNYGGMSWSHTLRLLEEVPGLKLAFDTGNPALQLDYRGDPPFRSQSPWEFYTKVKDHIAYVHIKDALRVPESGEEEYRFPGEGAGEVKKIVGDLLDTGYKGGFSMEPHMAVVYHDSSVTAAVAVRENNFIEYGRRFMRLLKELGYEYT